MATNVTTDAIKYMEKKLKDAQIHLDCAEKRWANAKVRLAEKKANNPKKYGDRPDLEDEGTEIINLKRVISHYELAITAIKEKQRREEGIKVNFKEINNG